MRHRLLLLGLILFAVLLRLWGLGDKGLSYDEAASALMARATPWEIVLFHWQAAFEHPPFWQLLLYSWSILAGQSEYALRFLPALAGVLHVPLVWLLARRINLPGRVSTPLLAALFVTVAPVLLLYSQEARMYTIVVACALLSLVLLLDLTSRPTTGRIVAFVAINWLMLGMHYYSALLLVAEGLYLLWSTLRLPRDGKRPEVGVYAALLLSGLPLLGWMIFAPGFRTTASVVLGGVGGEQPTIQTFLTELWRDLSFGAFRWQPEFAWIGFLLLPLTAIGLVQTIRSAWTASGGARLLLMAVLLPVLLSALLFRGLATRYILFVVPLLAIWWAAGIVWLWGIDRRLGAVVLAAALLVCAGGLVHYFARYIKSEYREMAAYLQESAQPGDGFLLEAPRQHLLAKYYLPADWRFYTAPDVTLPDYWPFNAPPVVPEEMDDLLQQYLRNHANLWLILTAENEVDKGEFVPKYLTAVGYRVECRDWLDVRLCRFIGSNHAEPESSREWNVSFGDELVLERSTLAHTPALDPAGNPTLLVMLDWYAARQPTIDYRVTVRLLATAETVVAQHDDYPIGPLLPPTTWQASDRKPGYVALTLPQEIGPLRVVLGVYDPNTGAQISSGEGRWVELGVVGE